MKVREPGGARGGGGPAGERTPGDSWPALQGRPVLRRSIAVGLVLCVAFMGVLLVRGVNALTIGRPVPETDRDRAELLAGLHPSQHPGAGRYYVPVGAVYTHTPDGVPVAYLHYRLGSGRPVDVADFLRTYDLPAPGPLAPLPADLTAALGGDEPAEASELPEVGTAGTPSPSPSLPPSGTTAPEESPSASPSPSLAEPPAPTPGPMASPTATAPPDPQPSPSSPETSPSPSDPCTASARPTGESAEGDDEGDEEGDGEEAAQTPSPTPTVSATEAQTQAQTQAPVLVPAAAVAESEPVPTAAPSPTVTPSPTATPSPTVIRTPTAGRRIYVATTSGGLTGATDIYVRASG